MGKSGIVKRFLFNQYTDRYKPTVEDLYNREFDLGPVTIKVWYSYTPRAFDRVTVINKSLEAVVCSTVYHVLSHFMKVKNNFQIYSLRIGKVHKC